MQVGGGTLLGQARQGLTEAAHGVASGFPEWLQSARNSPATPALQTLDIAYRIAAAHYI